MQSDEAPPKRPLSAYFLFVGQNRVAVKTANPAFKSTQIVQVTRAPALDCLPLALLPSPLADPVCKLMVRVYGDQPA